MENFSTPHRALVPWVANVATVAVLLTATWWSNMHRPAPVSAEAAVTAPTTLPQAPVVQPTAAPAQTSNNQAGWPVQTTSVPRDGLQAVGYNTARR